VIVNEKKMDEKRKKKLNIDKVEHNTLFEVDSNGLST